MVSELTAEIERNKLAGRAEKKGVTAKDVDAEELKLGIKTEMEHTNDPATAKRIALDHLAELPHYYSKMLLPAEKRAEKQEKVKDKEESARLHDTMESVACSLVERSVELNGQTYVPDQAKAYVIATMMTSFPAATKFRRAWTAATISNSAPSMKDQLVDREHNLKFYAAQRGSTKDDVVGHLVDFEFPKKKKAMELAAEGQGVPFRVLLCLYRKVEGVEAMLPDIAAGVFKLSQECEYDREASAFTDGEKFYPWNECSDAMKSCLQKNTVAAFKDAKTGKTLPLFFCPGGEDGEVLFSGCAMTKWPLDITAKTESLAAAEVRPVENQDMQLTQAFESLVCAEAWRGDNVPDELFAFVPPEARGKNGKKSLRQFPLASKSRKGLDPAILCSACSALSRFEQAGLPAGSKAGVITKIQTAIDRWNRVHPDQKIEVSSNKEFEVSGMLYAGCTQSAACPGLDGKTLSGHSHAIMSNGMVMPSSDGHSHGLEILSIDLGAGELCAVTTSAYDYLTQPAVPGEAAMSGGASPSRSKYEHKHIVRLTKDSASSGETDVTGAITTAVSAVAVKGDVSMKMKEICAGLRKTAASLKDKDAEASAQLEQQAADLEKAEGAEAVETTIAAKVAAGELIPKAAHEQAVSAAATAAATKAKTELQAELSAKEAAAKVQAETTKTRLASVVSAGLKAETPLGKDRTILSAVSAIPVGPDGDKLFTEKVEEWVTLKAAKKDSAASAGGPDVHLHGLGGSDGGAGGEQKTELTPSQRVLAIA